MCKCTQVYTNQAILTSTLLVVVHAVLVVADEVGGRI